MYSIVKNAKTLHRVSGFRQAMKLFDQVVGRSDPFKDVIGFGIMVMLLKNGSMALFLITVIIPLIVIPGCAYILARMDAATNNKRYNNSHSYG